MIPYSRQHIDEDDIAAVVKVLKSDWLTQGPAVAEFEKTLAEHCGARYAVAVPNGTAALYLAYRAIGLKEGDEIITTPNTFAATTNMAIECGAKPVFCDIRLDTYNIDENQIERLITPRTKAIVPVHFAGHPCEMDKIHQVAKKHDLLVIEDACHAIGAVYKDKKIGSFSDLIIFSFHPVKPITTGEGGAILTDNKEYYETMLRLRIHGIAKNQIKQQEIGNWHYEARDLSFNFRITDIQCALGTSQLKKLGKMQQKREAIARKYFEALKNVPGIVLPTNSNNIKHSWHLFVVRFKNSQIRKAMFKHFQDNGVGVQVHYIPVYQHPYYQKIGYQSLKLENTEQYYNTCLSLPLYPELTDEQFVYVIRALKEGLEKLPV